MKRRIKKICAIIGMFILFTILFTPTWYVIEKRLFNHDLELSELTLHILGYTSADTHSAFWKLTFSLIGIFSIALLSSVFTMSLFDGRRRLIIGGKLILWFDDNQQELSFYFYNEHRDLYNVNISIFTDGEKAEDIHSSLIPYFPKNSSKRLSHSAEPGSIIYGKLRESVQDSENNPSITCLISYVDSGDGQEYYSCQNYEYDTDIDKTQIIPVGRNALEIKTFRNIIT